MTLLAFRTKNAARSKSIHPPMLSLSASCLLGKDTGLQFRIEQLGDTARY